ncbi:ABC transporter substrate-binding protein [Actinocorallia sp. A-T 12471]|uniref:ABC transporter substrate-binding protein n=1 Tax=Actinocorallia sp. A-T 12471 TaxID=3089813 RepID=UPI0029CFCE5C|nr:ABC transporter substrate-binding protein [Actinocorallia sp. A-T 12471]MDX6744293.1 ABC transporter substrate-binding protein [Actinocorallia sp. A-T 12471]
MKTRFTAVAAAAVALMLSAGLSACGGGDDGDSFDTSPADFALTGMANPSDAKGGTLRFGHSDDWDSPDMGNTYYAYSMNFGRLYSRALTTFSPEPGKTQELVPDLAESLGQVSDDGLTWTYKIRPGIKYDDGTPVTSKDVKHAVERSNFTKELTQGPHYFQGYLKDNKEPYKGPYDDKSEKGLESIETPDDTTIVFHLNQPFAEFDYLVSMQTSPVPAAKDTGLDYEKSILSTGPYKIDSYERGKVLKLSRNPHWDPATDPVRANKALPENIEVTLKINADDLDNRLLSGAIDIDLPGTGVQQGAQPKVLGNSANRANSDNPVAGYLRYLGVNPNVKPFDNVHCRRAVQYALDKVSTQTAHGGPEAGGSIASTVLPPSVTGYKEANVYPSGADNHGDLEKAKQELTECGQPNGFKTTLSVRSDREKEVAAGEAVQQGLARVGIEVDIESVPAGDYFGKFAGSPKWIRDNNVGLLSMAWAPDWPSGYGFLSQIVDSRTIRDSGNTNIQETKLPEVDKLLDDAAKNTDIAQREAIYTKIDELVMEDATILPLIYAKILLVRPPHVTNLTITEGYGGMYDYLNIGVR